ncbi:MAG: tetratricopeptide repeat protein [Planctomycetota bacterium]
MSELNELYKQADALKHEGKPAEAVEVLNTLLEKDPNHTLSHLALAVLYGKIDQHDKAIEHGQKACELSPEDPFSFTAMSVTFQRAWAGTQKQEYIQMAEDAMARAQMLEGGHTH